MNLDNGFQSAPLTDVRGDYRTMNDIDAILEFQSAPLTDVRGDARQPRLSVMP